MSIDVLSSKALERQIKVLEDNIFALQGQIEALMKKREACHVLLDIDVPELASQTGHETNPSSGKKSSKKKTAKTDEEVLLADIPPLASESFDPTSMPV